MSDYVANRPARWPVRPLMDQRSFALHLTGTIALVFVLAASGAFSSDGLPLPRRILMFAVVSGLLVAQTSVVAEVLRRGLRSSRAVAAGCAILALAAVLALMTFEIHLLKATPIVPYSPDPLPEFALFLMPFVVPVSALVLSLKWSERPRRQMPPAPVDPKDEPALVCDEPLVDAIEGWPRDPVLRLQATDHYLQLWTLGGTSFLRGRMRDALRRLPCATGIQPHRSWWVALSEIDRIERSGRDLVLRLRDGSRLPVARARATAVKVAIERHREV